jgi:hypothetical protein
MPVLAPEHEWLRNAAALTIGPAVNSPIDPLTEGAATAADLASLATALHGARHDSQDGCACGSDPCHLSGGRGGADACDLAAALAASAPEGAPAPAGGSADLADRYLRALRDAAPAVYYCRRVLHPSGRCWFSTGGPDADLCGRVLSLSHRLAG